MPLKPPRQIPTTAVAIDEYLSDKAHARGYRDMRSVLRGADEIRGRRPAGVPLAKAMPGPIRVDRVKPIEWSEWLSERYGSLSPDALKKGRSVLRQFLRYCIDVGYAQDEAIKTVDALPTPAGNPRTGWLRPDQVLAFDALVTTDNFPDYVCLAWETLISYGLRAEELVVLEKDSLNRHDRTLTVVGKGQGRAKIRRVPVTEEYERRWAKYVLLNQVPQWMFPASDIRLCGNSGEVERVVDWSRRMSQKSLRTQLSKIYELAVEEAKADRFDVLLIPPIAAPPEPHPLSPHNLRRTYACTTLISHSLGLGGLDLRSLQQNMGHTRLDTTAGYLATADEWLGRHRVFTPTVESARAIMADVADRVSGAAAAPRAAGGATPPSSVTPQMPAVGAVTRVAAAPLS